MIEHDHCALVPKMAKLEAWGQRYLEKIMQMNAMLLTAAEAARKL